MNEEIARREQMKNAVKIARERLSMIKLRVSSIADRNGIEDPFLSEIKNSKGENQNV